MAPLRRNEEPGWDDGPSRPGVAGRRIVIFLISGLLLVSTPVFLLILWGMADPTYGPAVVKRTTWSWSHTLNVGQGDWSRLVRAADEFATPRGLVDKQTGSLVPTSELRRSRVSYESPDAELEIERNTTKANADITEIHVRIREFDGSGAGQRLKSAFENDVIRAGRFGE